MESLQDKDQRLRSLTQACLFSYPSFGEILSYIPMYATADSVIAATDGTMIKFGDAFFKNYNAGEQAFIILHEALHVALRHAVRSRNFVYDFSTADLWNIAADCVINRSLQLLTAACSSIVCPKDATTFEEILEQEDLRNRPLKDWTCEHLFQFLLEKTSSSSDSSGLQQSKSSKVNKALTSLMKDLSPTKFDQPIPDYLKNESFAEDNSGVADSLIWAARLERALAGSSTLSVLQSLTAELPRITTPWQEQLRQFVSVRLLPDREFSWKRPSRLVAAGVVDHFEPYKAKKRGLKTIAVLLDVSGSCFDAECFAEFVANVQQLQEISGAKILLVVFDTKVTSTELINNDGRTFSSKLLSGEIQVKGGGGTCFVAPFKELDKHTCDVAVVLTDGYGTFPLQVKTPASKIIWAMTSNVVAPFGKTIKLQKY